ncbi:cytochrome P450 [Umezawaea tangerina]|uniref:Cytochrome P450 n=1 Tax=Umezawaea tangerina TaxID=84725 RepID=A0A2T0SGF6_9PSEU|nr:cytochrome P450 [Umezawaea tangerina]PRY32489.1 cytochrome P450 [Umezawaea tangerina]
MTETPSAPDLAIRRGCPYGEPDGNAELREEGPVTRVRLGSGKEAWAVWTHAAARELLLSDAFSVDRKQPDFPALVPYNADVGFRASIGEMDAPEHGAARRAINGEFTQRRVDTMRADMQKVVDELIDAMLDGPKPADLVPALALPVPTTLICDLLGVPDADRDTFRDRSSTMIDLFTPPQERMAAIGALLGYIDQLVTGKEENPSDDLIGRRVLKAREDGDGTDHQSLVELALTLLVAGFESTANQISLSIAALLQHPDQLELLRREPERWPAAVEELLRYCSILNPVSYRVVKEDVTIAGVAMSRGEGVVALGTAVNRDPEVFADPDRLDVTRTDGRHLSFGYGAHMCIGQHMARTELQIVFETLFRRVPGLRLAVPAEELSFKDEAAAYGLNSLPVTW